MQPQNFPFLIPQFDVKTMKYNTTLIIPVVQLQVYAVKNLVHILEMVNFFFPQP